MISSYVNQSKSDVSSGITIPSYNVLPINEIEPNLKKFNKYYNWIQKKHFEFKLKSNGLRKIELIKCQPKQTHQILKEMEERGYLPAPSPYLLGIGIQYPGAVEKYGAIVSLDQNNLFVHEGGELCFLDVFWQEGCYLNLAESKDVWDPRWWFAVIRVESFEK